MELQTFIQRLALFLASWQATTFLVGEYTEDEMRDNPIFTVADGLFLLSQANSCSGCLRMPAAKRRERARPSFHETFKQGKLISLRSSGVFQRQRDHMSGQHAWPIPGGGQRSRSVGASIPKVEQQASHFPIFMRLSTHLHNPSLSSFLETLRLFPFETKAGR